MSEQGSKRWRYGVVFAAAILLVLMGLLQPTIEDASGFCMGLC